MLINKHFKKSFSCDFDLCVNARQDIGLKKHLLIKVLHYFQNIILLD